MTLKKLLKTIFVSIIIAIIILVLIIFLLYLWFVKRYNEDAEARRQPISEPETYSEFAYIKSAYEEYREYVDIYRIENDGVLKFTVSVDKNADKDMWFDIVSGFAENVNRSGQQISIVFYSGTYVQGPFCIKISNCEYINEQGQIRYNDSYKVCFVDLDSDFSDRYEFWDMIDLLDAEYVYLEGRYFVEKDRQEFADRIQKTGAKRILVWCQIWDSDADEKIKEYQQTLQELIPSIDVFCY